MYHPGVQHHILVYYGRYYASTPRTECSVCGTMRRLTGNNCLWVLLIMLRVLPALSQLCSNSACIPEDYNKMDLPRPTEGGPVVVHTSIFLLDIFKVHSDTFALDLSLSMAFKWRDDRINLTQGEVTVGESFLEQVWKPDLYIWNLKEEFPVSEHITRHSLDISKVDGG